MYAMLLSLTLVCATLSGCAAGHKFSYAYSKIKLDSVGPVRSASIAVLDQREYVLSGSKAESFVGLSKEGFATPFDVETYSGAPMAAEMGTSIATALQGKWRQVRTIPVRPADGPERARRKLLQTGADRALLFTFNDWETDTMLRTALRYDVTLDVLDSSGHRLARSQVSGEEASGVSLLSPEQIVQKWFADKITALLQDESVATTLEERLSAQPIVARD